MQLSEQLRQELAQYNLLGHPFYQAWMRGELSLEQLQKYSKQYKAHVDAFPRYVSAIHSQCEVPTHRQQLLHNLMEEEGVGYDKNHPELWKDFGHGLGVKAHEWDSEKPEMQAQNLVDTYWKLCRSSYGEGLAALFAYEYQVPEVAKLKIEGLKKFYDIEDESTLKFFAVHEEADKEHSQVCANMIDQLPENQRQEVLNAGKEAAQALWNFLSEVYEVKGAPIQ